MLHLCLSCSLLLVLITGLNGVNIEDCGSVLAETKSATVTNCTEDVTRCELKMGTNVSLSVDFQTKASIAEINVQVIGILLNIPYHFSIDNPDGCKNSGLVCPLAAGVNVTYTTTLYVSPYYPRISVNLQWILKNQNNNPIICLLIPAKFV